MMYTKKWLTLFGAFICTLPLLMAPTGGFPSRPTFQQISVGASPPSTGTQLWVSDAAPDLWLNESDQAANSRVWGIQAQGAVFSVLSCPDNLSGCTSLLTADRSGNLTANNGVAITPTAGTFSATLTTGCGVQPPITFRYRTMADHVFLRADAFTCTSNTGVHSTGATDVPAALRPSGSRHCVMVLQDNGAAVLGAVTITAGGQVLYTNSVLTVLGSTGTFGNTPGGTTQDMCVYALT